MTKGVLTAALLVSSLALAGGRPQKQVVSKAVLAAEAKVSVQAEVVFAATSPGTIEPELVPMQQKLSSKVKYLTMKKLSSQRFELDAKPQVIQLPNGKAAELSLELLKEGVATVRVKLPPANTTYTLARDKAFHLQAGPHEGGEVWLVLSQPK